MFLQLFPIRFNSTTVQLILFEACARIWLLPMFQFHNGTINTIQYNVNQPSSLGFNSTTVQLILLNLQGGTITGGVSIPQRYN